MDVTAPLCAKVSANKRKLHFCDPLGTAEHRNAINCASTRPSNVFSWHFVCVLPYRANAKLSSTKRCRKRSISRWPT